MGGNDNRMLITAIAAIALSVCLCGHTGLAEGSQVEIQTSEESPSQLKFERPLRIPAANLFQWTLAKSGG